MKVRFLTNASCAEGVFYPGQSADLSDEQAEEFIGVGACEVVEEKPTRRPRSRKAVGETAMTSASGTTRGAGGRFTRKG